MLNLLDLTLLNQEASPQALRDLQKDARLGVAALCVYPEHLAELQDDLPCKKATVVNFPTGTHDLDAVLAMIEMAENSGAQEIDYVFPYQAYQQGKKFQSLNHCEQVYHFCQKRNLLFKVIVESGELPSDLLYPLCSDILAQGCDFLKTSTGKTNQGASLEAAQTILSAIKNSGSCCGMKVSGGIKTKSQAHAYIQLAEEMMQRKVNNQWFRIGTSTLIAD